jgi:hypothetical protein
MTERTNRPSRTISDDVFRDRLAGAITALEVWAHQNRDVAEIETSEGSTHWCLRSLPHQPGACAFELILNANQTFSLNLGGEIYEDRPIDQLEFFPMLARAIAGGHVERIQTLNAMTGAREQVDMRVTLEDGWAWVGERRMGPRQSKRAEALEERRREPYLAYRR